VVPSPAAQLEILHTLALQVAPVTAQHIFKLVAMGAYTGNHIFRVDKGFVAQVADVAGGRNVAMDAQQQVSAASQGSNLQNDVQQQLLLKAPNCSSILSGCAQAALSS
jgi:cyclophilin family peptidyl-prolyl cis-trans isomerase